jgi:hypothetical protein
MTFGEGKDAKGSGGKEKQTTTKANVTFNRALSLFILFLFYEVFE